MPAVDGRCASRRRQEVAYVRFATFSEGAHGELRDEIERLYRRGAEGLILDLRGNGGGLLNEAVLSSSIFVEDGDDRLDAQPHRGRARLRGRRRRDRPASDRRAVNRDTASAVRDPHRRARGLRPRRRSSATRTFGKGTFQEVHRRWTTAARST